MTFFYYSKVLAGNTASDFKIKQRCNRKYVLLFIPFSIGPNTIKFEHFQIEFCNRQRTFIVEKSRVIKSHSCSEEYLKCFVLERDRQTVKRSPFIKFLQKRNTNHIRWRFLIGGWYGSWMAGRIYTIVKQMIVFGKWLLPDDLSLFDDAIA